MKRAMFLAIAISTLSAALACGEREEYKGSGSRSLEDPSADGGGVISSSSGGVDAASDVKTDSTTSDADSDAFIDAKVDG